MSNSTVDRPSERKRFDFWLWFACVLYVAHIFGWFGWAIWRVWHGRFN